MRGVGVIQDGFAFTEAEIERSTPRFWWGATKREAYRRVLERRGIGQHRDDRDDDRDEGPGHDGPSGRDDSAAAAAVATVAMADTFDEKRTEGGGVSSGGWFSGSKDDGAAASESGASDAGGVGSNE